MKITPSLLPLILAIASLVISIRGAIAQTYTPSNRIPVADGTMNTQVAGSGSNFTIVGGVNRGQTLFHSFSDFSIPTNGAANFSNATNARDIITRVTGGSFSDINGLLDSNGANFFLINPNGVTFGTNAQLNVGKVFVTSTANSLDLVDAGGRTITFGTNASGDAPLLSVAPNVLFDVSRLNFGGGNGQISNYGTLQTANFNQYIGLIGGNVNSNGGLIVIDADGGRVELGGLSASGDVTLSQDANNLKAQFPTNVTRSDVSLTDRATIFVSNGGGGDIFITTGNLEILEKSFLATGIFPGFGTQDSVAGDIKIVTSGDIVLADNSTISNTVGTGGIGKGGAIEIAAGGNISIANIAGVVTSTQGTGDAGNLKIAAGGDISFNAGDVLSTVTPDAVGKGGEIEISAKRNLSLVNGAGLSTSIFGRGDAGNIKIIVMGDIAFDRSSASSSVLQEAVGRGGGIEIVAGKSLLFTNEARLGANTSGQGDAGMIKITAGENVSFNGGSILSLVDTGAIGTGGGIEITTAKNLSLVKTILSASTSGTGDAGSITINVAGDFAAIDGGALFNSTSGIGNAGSVKITTEGNVSFDGVGGAFSSVLPEAIGTGKGIEIVAGKDLFVSNESVLSASTSGRGDAGSVKLTAGGNVTFDRGVANSAVAKGAVGNGGGIEIVARKNLALTNGGVTSSSLGQGNAGNIVLTANTIGLNGGAILSTSSSFPGGDIQVNIQDFLLLRNNSSIATDSFSTDANGNGGNITIGSPLIIATPGNNDITANAFQGDGGRVNITSQGLFGIKFRPIGSDLTSDITASSTFGQSGTVNIDTPGSDPGRDTTELPNNAIDASNQISQVCSANTRENKLTVTGRGGLPPTAYEPQTSDVVWQDPRVTGTQPVASNAPTRQLPPPAVGMAFDGKGKVTLIAAGAPGQQVGTRVVCPTTNADRSRQ
jgi:filamentous hemagglutinin family protein